MPRPGLALSAAVLLAAMASTSAFPSTHVAGIFTINVTLPPVPSLHALGGGGGGGGHTPPPSFAEDELVDSKKAAARLDTGACSQEQCFSHCRQKLHAGGRCDQELCLCRDLKARGRCQVYGFGCGSDGEDGPAGRSIVNNNNNNNVLVVH